MRVKKHTRGGREDHSGFHQGAAVRTARSGRILSYLGSRTNGTWCAVGVRRRGASRISPKCGGKFSEARNPGGVGDKPKGREQSWWWLQARILYPGRCQGPLKVETALLQRLRIC